MGHLHLIIKGNRQQSINAAKERGITLFHTRLSRHGEPVEIHAMCGDEYQPQVMQWFNESPLEAPFPTGTLLHWSEQTRVDPTRKHRSEETYEDRLDDLGESPGY